MNYEIHKTNDPRRYCRECGHGEFRHTRKVFECGYVATFLSSGNSEDFCPCDTFVPEDNLEFLEYKVKQKENERLLLG